MQDRQRHAADHHAPARDHGGAMALEHARRLQRIERRRCRAGQAPEQCGCRDRQRPDPAMRRQKESAQHRKRDGRQLADIRQATAAHRQAYRHYSGRRKLQHRRRRIVGIADRRHISVLHRHHADQPEQDQRHTILPPYRQHVAPHDRRRNGKQRHAAEQQPHGHQPADIDAALLEQELRKGAAHAKQRAGKNGDGESQPLHRIRMTD